MKNRQINSIVKKLRNGHLAIECSFCEGSGAFPATATDNNPLDENEPCPVCHGKGVNIFHAKPADIIGCRYCDSSGRQLYEGVYFMGDICSVCNGTGVNILEPLAKYQISTLNEFMWTMVHPIIVSVAKSRFESEHYADSVEAALKEVNKRVKDAVKEKIGLEFDGASLMQKAFSTDNPILKLSDLSNESGKNIQKGYLQIFSGAMTGIRNPKAHENIVIDRNRAIHLLFFASLLMYKIDETVRSDRNSL